MLIIALIAAIDLYLDINRGDRYTYKTFGVYMSEINEMMIGIVGVLYLWLQRRMFRRD